MPHKLATNVCEVKCATCPFRVGSKYACLAADIAQSALTQANRICHSTGSNNGINRRTGKPSRLCRGARDLQIRYFVSIGFLKEATDEAWAKKLAEMNAQRKINLTPRQKTI